MYVFSFYFFFFFFPFPLVIPFFFFSLLVTNVTYPFTTVQYMHNEAARRADQSRK